jgi:hypothetical protein
MTTSTARIAIAVLFAASLAACKPAEAPKEAAAPAVVLSAPTGTDDGQWQAYLQQEIGAKDDVITDRLYTYYLPADSKTPDAQDGSSMYQRQLDNVTGVVLRTVLPGNMLAFGSPDSATMADLIVGAFTGAKPDALKGSHVLFIGNAADNARVKAAVEASGANYIFVEAK